MPVASRPPTSARTQREARARGFARVASLSIGDGAGENRLVVSDNARALRWICLDFAGQIRGIYIDPPYNTGRRFDEYDDKKTSEAWLSALDDRLPLLRALLRDDGAIVAQIDDTELANLTLALDRAFGRENRIATVTVVRSAATGHKARNLGPVNVSDYLLFYAKDRKRVRLNAQVRARDGLDPAYSTVIENPNAATAKYRFAPLRAHVAKLLGHASALRARRALGESAFEREVATWALANARAVVRFAEPRYEAVGKPVQRAIDESKKHPARVIVLERAAHKPVILRGGNRLLFLSDKAREIDGAMRIVEPLTTVWTDVPFQGIAREGGVVFIRNKKPERLMMRILAMVSDPGDWVLDPYLGSGTTAAVAHKMGRRWIGIEEGAHALEMARERLARVVRGEDRTGVTKALNFQGGGGFGVYR
jgi:adenine-specific DNA-methyltransferase